MHRLHCWFCHEVAHLKFTCFSTMKLYQDNGLVIMKHNYHNDPKFSDR